MILTYVLNVQAHDLRNAKSAIEKNAENTVITLFIFTVDRGEEGLCFLQRKVAGQRIGYLGHIKIL